jgi:hypothetical protein
MVLLGIFFRAIRRPQSGLYNNFLAEQKPERLLINSVGECADSIYDLVIFLGD